MLVGYARVSTPDQVLDLQLDALEKAGCDRIFTEKMSSIKAERPGLEEARSHLREGDTLVVWRLDRLGRSLKDLLDIVGDLKKKDIGFKSLQEGFDTTTSGGRLIFHVFGALAEFEREVNRDRTNAGLAAARARGRFGGRRKKYSDELIRKIRTDAETSELTIDEICREYGISRHTFYNRKLK